MIATTDQSETLPGKQEVATPDWSKPLKGIDVNAGLLIWNQEKIYQKALFSFARYHAGDAERIAQALQQKKWQEAKSVTHALKGVSANLAAIELAKIACEIDTMLAKTDSTTDQEPGKSTGVSAADSLLLQQLAEANQRLEQELARMVDSIALLKSGLSNITEQNRPPEVQPNESTLAANQLKTGSDATAKQNTSPPLSARQKQILNGLLKQLWQFIDQTDLTRADAMINQIQQEFDHIIPVKSLKNIIMKLDNFDFDYARIILEELINSLPETDAPD